MSVDTQRLAGLIRILLSELLGLRSAELSICLLGDHAIARLNEGYVGHAGPTDVITFDYRNTVSEGILAGAGKPELRGEICIGVHEARRQARRYRCDWSHEVVRYVIHGVLHLLGYDDGEVAARRRMKRLEDRLLQRLVARMGPLRLDRSFGASRRLVAGRVET
ncbi:MAG: rRNA maturation RNase YbeY [Verrucomicrobiota bacterium]|nr:rRNA maturation RNase YbeY [Verrucomicrobiota bacterium]